MSQKRLTLEVKSSLNRTPFLACTAPASEAKCEQEEREFKTRERIISNTAVFKRNLSAVAISQVTRLYILWISLWRGRTCRRP